MKQTEVDAKINFCTQCFFRGRFVSKFRILLITMILLSLAQIDLLFVLIVTVGAREKNIQAKILDFQSYDYESFAFDLTFFLLFNAQVVDLRENFSSYILYYNLEFRKTLVSVKCPLDDYTQQK